MIAERNTEIEVQSTIQGERIVMGIDQAAMAHIMNVLTDLYSDPELAVIREYSTNAFDAHVEAGQRRPIEVDTPTPLSPFLKVRDFGVGLSVQDVHEVYSRYGASTKRATNDQVGMLGLGCKSALTYAQQFTVVAVKDGVRVQVAISRDDDGGGSMTVVDTSATTDGPGVEILIPARTGNQIARKAEQFFRFWRPGTVLLNGIDPSGVEGLEITPDITVTNDREHSYVVMGNVAYPISGHFDSGLQYGYNVVARVPIGSVNFTPSREALHYTAKTKATLASLQAELRTALPNAVQRAVDGCKTHSEALATFMEWRGITSRFGVTGIKFRGKDLPESYDFGDTAGVAVVVPRSSYVLSRCSTHRTLDISYLPKSVFFHGYEEASFTAGKKRKLNQWADDNGVSADHYVLVKDKPRTEWIEPDQIHAWADVKAIKLPSNRPLRTTGRIPGSYDLYDDGVFQFGQPAGDIDQSKPVYYEQDKWLAGRLASLLGACTVVVLPSPRVAKFLRNFPQAQKARDVVRDQYDAWKAGLTADQIEALHIQDSGGGHTFRHLDAKRVDDPALKRVVRLVKMDVDKVRNDRNVYRDVLGHLEGHKPFDNPLKNYPLFDAYKLRGLAADHTYLYLNAAYAARKAGTLA